MVARWTRPERMTLFILFNTYGFDPRSTVWWPIYTSIHGTARRWITVSEDWRFRGTDNRSEMWRDQIEKPRSAYSQGELVDYQQMRASVDATAARLNIAIPPATQPAPIAMPAAPVASSSVAATPIPAASASSIMPAVSFSGTMPVASSSSTIPVASSSTAVPTATVPAIPSSSTVPVAAGSSSRFDVFIGKLHALKKLPVVHTRQVDTSAPIPTVRISNADRTLKLPAEIFLLAGTPFAPQVNRVMFSDQLTGENAEVDVVFCTSCVACGTHNPATNQHAAVLPVVHNSDIAMTPGQGATFQPEIQSRTLTAVHSDQHYQMDVYFTGGKRVLVEVVA